jgi:hypothetical protein
VADLRARARAVGRRVAHRVGLRGGALLFFAELDLLYGYGLAFPSPLSAASGTNRYFASLLPLRAWSVLWFGVALICLYHAFHRYDRPAFIAAIGIKMLWGTFSLIGVIYADVPIGSMAIWLSLAGLVWILSKVREPWLDIEDVEQQ